MELESDDESVAIDYNIIGCNIAVTFTGGDMPQSVSTQFEQHN